MNKYLNVDIKKDSVFKNVFLRNEGRILIANIISNLYGFNLKDLLDNLKLYNSEHPRINTNIKPSYSDIIYVYKNKIFIIEMNKSYYKKSIYKNHFYLLFRHVFDANNKNNYNMNKETYLIDIDNFDIKCELGIKENNKLVSHGRLVIESDNLCIYNNIKTTRINLDYLKKKKYNYNALTNIERNCLIFVEQNKEKLKKYGNYKNIEGVVKLLEVIEINGKYYPKFDKEEWEESLRQEMKERGLKEGRKIGLEQGIKKGIKEGRMEEKITLAKSLKLKNFKIEEISELTGLNIEKIQKL